MDINLYKNGILESAKDLEESSVYSFKGHYNSSDIWIIIKKVLSFFSIVLASLASISAFKDSLITSGILSAITAIISGITVFLNPDECIKSHKNAGDNFLSLSRRLRHFWKVDLLKFSEEDARKELNIFSNEYDKLVKDSRPICQLAYKSAKKNIESGGNEFNTDKKDN